MKSWIDKSYTFNFPDIRGTLDTIQYPAVCQVKLDGELNQLLISDNLVEIRNKTKYGRRRTNCKITEEAKQLGNAVLIGELYYKDGKNFYDFLRNRENDELKIVIFDIESRNGIDLRNELYVERIAVLQEMFKDFNGSHIELVKSEWIDEKLQAEIIFNTYKQQNYEGIVVKSLSMKLTSLASTQMAKIKVKAMADLAVIGFRDDAKYLSLVLGYKNGQGWKKVCCVGGGFEHAEKLRIKKILDPLVVRKIKHELYIEPEKANLVAQVEYQGFTTSGNDSKITSLRMPIFIRWRDDKNIEDISFDTIK